MSKLSCSPVSIYLEFYAGSVPLLCTNSFLFDLENLEKLNLLKIHSLKLWVKEVSELTLVL